MNQNEMIQSLRAEIAKLQRVVDLLVDQPRNPEHAPVQSRRPGRPKGPAKQAVSFNPEEFAPAKRTMSAEGKARIAAAQKKRWAAQKGSAAKTSASKQSSSTKRANKTTPSKTLRGVAPSAKKKSAAEGKTTGSTRAVSAKRSSKTASKRVTNAANAPSKQTPNAITA